MQITIENSNGKFNGNIPVQGNMRVANQLYEHVLIINYLWMQWKAENRRLSETLDVNTVDFICPMILFVQRIILLRDFIYSAFLVVIVIIALIHLWKCN